MDNMEEKLAAMKNTDIKTVDPDLLTDIRDVKINAELPKSERILDFIKQVRNPYCFRYKDVIIKLSFDEANENTLEEQFKNYLNSL